jgi:hypothetical protein
VLRNHHRHSVPARLRQRGIGSRLNAGQNAHSAPTRAVHFPPRVSVRPDGTATTRHIARRSSCHDLSCAVRRAIAHNVQSQIAPIVRERVNLARLGVSAVQRRGVRIASVEASRGDSRATPLGVASGPPQRADRGA